jgi:hypothetical protein
LQERSTPKISPTGDSLPRLRRCPPSLSPSGPLHLTQDALGADLCKAPQLLTDNLYAQHIIRTGKPNRQLKLSTWPGAPGGLHNADQQIASEDHRIFQIGRRSAIEDMGISVLGCTRNGAVLPRCSARVYSKCMRVHNLVTHRQSDG